MKSFVVIASLAVVTALPIHAADNYADSLKASDEALAAHKSDTALTELEAALQHASNDGERALALAKKGYVLAYEKKDYAKAREAVDEALKVEGLAPVARVTALQVLAQCQVKADKNFQEAAGNLETALTLEGVDWAKPGLTMDLAGCYRELHDDAQALTAYQQVVAMAGADKAMKAGAHLFSAFIYQYGMKDAVNAKKSYAAAVELRPDLKKEVDGHLSKLQ